MSIFKCKMCGGTLEIDENNSIAVCEYCGTKQTVPKDDSDKKLSLFARANKLRFACEFDKAYSVYESIVAEFPEDAEAYWGLILCKYGIEYVDDPATGKKIPTCRRSGFESVMDDPNFELVMEYSDAVARKVYREEAKYIEELRKSIIEVSGREEPYDIFICYKETAENGDRTLDSVLAQDVYDVLTDKGYRVFFSRITLEDKLGQEYEPYIFAALHSAKVMLAFGTDYDYFNAVWVKNEWSRYLQLMATDRSKHLIPCYKDIDAYDMPKEFAKLQAQDMGKVGAVQDLLRGIEKLIGGKKKEKVVQQTVVTQVVQQTGGTEQSLLRRAELFMEESEWQKADEYLDRVLDINPECAEAYLDKVCLDYEMCSFDEFSEFWHIDYTENNDYKKAVRFANAELKEKLEKTVEQSEANRKNKIYNEAKEQQKIGAIESLNQAAELYAQIPGWKDADEQIDICRNKVKKIKEAAQKNFELFKSLISKKRENAKTLSSIICSGLCHTVGLKSDGTVIAVGSNYIGQCNVSNWKDIVAISCGYDHTVGLKSDGTVVAVGNNRDEQCNVSQWIDIVAISCGCSHTVGLKSDGTVVAAGDNIDEQCNVSQWKDIVAISCGYDHTVGLKSDGTVVAVGNNYIGQCNVSNWKDIVATSCGCSHTVGLKSNGTVVAIGYNEHDQCNVSQWIDIVAISCSGFHTIGLKSNGTVVAVGDNKYGQCDVSEWKDIVAIIGSEKRTIGLKSNGTVVAVGDNEDGQCNVSEWKLFNDVDSYIENLEKRKEAERIKAEYKKKIEEKQEQISALKAERSKLSLFGNGQRKKEIDAQVKAFEDEIADLKRTL